MTPGRSLVAVVVVALAGGCDSEPATGVSLTVRHDPALALDGLRVAGEIAGEPAFEPQAVPERPRPLDPAGESAVLLVSRALDGTMLTLQVEGMAGDAMMASGSVTVMVRAQQVVPTAVTLSLPGGGGGGDDDGGGGCMGGACCGDGLTCRGRCACEYDCRQASECPVDCAEASACDVDCREAASCGVTCRDGASCTVDCRKHSSCEGVVCRDGASCLLRCDGGNSDDDEDDGEKTCRFGRCDGPVLSCPGNWIACNRDCP